MWGYLTEIDQALRGTSFGEGMIEMFARIKAKESSNIESVSVLQWAFCTACFPYFTNHVYLSL